LGFLAALFRNKKAQPNALSNNPDEDHHTKHDDDETDNNPVDSVLNYDDETDNDPIDSLLEPEEKPNR